MWRKGDFETLGRHPNGLQFELIQDQKTVVDRQSYYSVGGGALADANMKSVDDDRLVYPHKSMKEIMQWCSERGAHLAEYVRTFEGPAIDDFLHDIWRIMQDSIIRVRNLLLHMTAPAAN